MATRTLTDKELAIQLHNEELRNAGSLEFDHVMAMSLQGTIESDAYPIQRAQHNEELPDVDSQELDHVMAMSLQDAFQEDANAIERAQREERVARNDHKLSLSLSGRRSHHVKTRTQQPKILPTYVDLELYSRLSGLNINGIRGENKKPSSPAKAEPRPKRESRPRTDPRPAERPKPAGQDVKCVCCDATLDLSKVAYTPCDHMYCGECFTELFSMANKDETMYPPRCCGQPIPCSPENLQFVRDDVLSTYEMKMFEYSVPANDRIYCHKPRCSAFILSDKIRNNAAYCAHCKSRTCVTCKGPEHIGYCPKDPETRKILGLARKEHWQRCPKCHQIIELDSGCYHMK
ncbi:hypothetical protein F4810DRAFT_726391 [Camillea tinctor]|nr:hypothetical protein F4810DRAFT_726391 [Camillea tinctor]